MRSTLKFVRGPRARQASDSRGKKCIAKPVRSDREGGRMEDSAVHRKFRYFGFIVRARRRRDARGKCIYINFERGMRREEREPPATSACEITNERASECATRTYRVSRNSHVGANERTRTAIIPEASGNFFRWTADSCARARANPAKWPPGDSVDSG